MRVESGISKVARPGRNRKKIAALQHKEAETGSTGGTVVSRAAVICLVTQRAPPRDETNNGCAGD